MSAAEIDLASTLIGVYLGAELGELISIIGGGDYFTAAQIRLRIDSFSKPLKILSSKNIEQLLATLIWHKFAKFRDLKGRPAYKVFLKDITRILQYPRYLYHITEIFGARGASMIETILLRGQLQASDIVDIELERERQSSTIDDEPELIDEIRAIFKAMVANRFLLKEPILGSPIDQLDMPKLVPPTESALIINFERHTQDDKASAKIQKLDTSSCGPEYWSLNHDRFTHYIKDQLLVERANLLCGQFAAGVLRNALRFCELGTSCHTVQYPISLMDIKKSCEEANIDFSECSLESILDLLIRSDFLSKDGGTYTVRIRDVIERMTIDSGIYHQLKSINLLINHFRAAMDWN